MLQDYRPGTFIEEYIQSPSISRAFPVWGHNGQYRVPGTFIEGDIQSPLISRAFLLRRVFIKPCIYQGVYWLSRVRFPSEAIMANIKCIHRHEKCTLGHGMVNLGPSVIKFICRIDVFGHLSRNATESLKCAPGHEMVNLRPFVIKFICRIDVFGRPGTFSEGQQCSRIVAQEHLVRGNNAPGLSPRNI